MEGIPREELERLMFFEQAREVAAEEYKTSPLDADNLTRWGGALLELAHFRQGPESVAMIDEAVSKLEEALRVDTHKHEAMWCLGNAFTSQGFLVNNFSEAQVHFDKAANCFKKALQEEPNNEMYKKALEMTAKAPSLHQELQKQLAAQAGAGVGPSSSQGMSEKEKARKAKAAKDSDFKYDVIGWCVLVGIAVVWIGMARASVPPPPAAPSR